MTEVQIQTFPIKAMYMRQALAEPDRQAIPAFTIPWSEAQRLHGRHPATQGWDSSAGGLPVTVSLEHMAEQGGWTLMELLNLLGSKREDGTAL